METTTVKEKNILVIDDDPDFRKMLCARLEKSGYKVSGAQNGLQGVNRFKEFPVHLVITDIIMPEKEGMETILEIKKINPEVKIIAISGGGRSVPEDYLNIAEYFGAVKSFKKPFDMADFIQTVDHLL